MNIYRNIAKNKNRPIIRVTYDVKEENGYVRYGGWLNLGANSVRALTFSDDNGFLEVVKVKCTIDEN